MVPTAPEQPEKALGIAYCYLLLATAATYHLLLLLLTAHFAYCLLTAHSLLSFAALGEEALMRFLASGLVACDLIGRTCGADAKLAATRLYEVLWDSWWHMIELLHEGSWRQALWTISACAR